LQLVENPKKQIKQMMNGIKKTDSSFNQSGTRCKMGAETGHLADNKNRRT